MPDVLYWPFSGLSGRTSIIRWSENWPGGKKEFVQGRDAGVLKPKFQSLGGDGDLYVVGHGEKGSATIYRDAPLEDPEAKAKAAKASEDDSLKADGLAKILHESVPEGFKGKIVLLVCEGGAGPVSFAKTLKAFWKVHKRANVVVGFEKILQVGHVGGKLVYGAGAGNTTEAAPISF